MKIKPCPLPSRAISLLLAFIFTIQTIPVSVLAAAMTEPVQTGTNSLLPPPEPAAASPLPVHVNRRPLSHVPLELVPQFSNPPTAAEFSRVRVFPLVLVPVGTPTAEENKALAEALAHYARRSQSDDQSIIINFLKQYPQSAWKPALLLNLGIMWRQAGFFSRAITAWEEAWNLSKNETEIKARGLADRTIGELAQIYVWTGETEKFDPLLAEVDNRNLMGTARETVSTARHAHRTAGQLDPDIYKCGPTALRQVLGSTGTNNSAEIQKLFMAKSTPRGFSLDRLQQLAGEAGMKYQMARRKPGSVIPPNSIIHWKLNHYGVLLREEADHYTVLDTSFAYFYGSDLSISKAALEEETDGYFLIPQGPLPAGWEPVTSEEGQKVFGRGAPRDGQNPLATKPNDCKICPTNAPTKMAQYSAHLMLVSLNIMDIPLWYDPPRGPSVRFGATYNQRDVVSGEQTLGQCPYSNIGIRWTLDWVSFITDNGTSGDRTTVSRFVSGGGTEIYSGSNGSYTPDRDGNTLQYIAASDTYELTMPDGSKQIFGQPTPYPGLRRMFLTAIVDPAGNALNIYYDSLERIDYVNDALGQTTQLYYELGDTRVTKIKDPFGRIASFEYDSSGRLKKITDMGGISSAFTYDPNNSSFINQMTTPYGTSSFSTWEDSDFSRRLTMTDPNGDTEMIYFRQDVICQDINDHSLPIPTSPMAPRLQWDNNLLIYRNTFYFDKKAYQMSGGGADYSYATIYHWLHDNDNDGVVYASEILESMKRPLESRIWFLYPGQQGSVNSKGITLRKPSVIGRLVDNPDNPASPVTQAYQIGYNSQGMVTSITDPLNRKTALDYYPNGIDLQFVRQTTGGMNDVLAQFGAYNAHRPSSYTNASLQVYNLQWNTYGQLTDVTNPKNELVHLNYDANSYLQNVQQPWAGGTKTTSLGYDGYGRVRTVTNSDNYVLNYKYDALDRLTNVTYPDQTFEQYDYDRLDLVHAWDRARHQTVITYDGVGRPISVADRLGQTNLFSWCGCGGLESLTDPLGHITSWVHDVEGRVTDKVYFDNTANHFAYEPYSGRLLSATDAESQVKHYTYNLDDTLANITYTGAKVPTPSVGFAYDSNYRRLTSVTDGTGSTIFDYYPVTTGGTLGARRLHTVDGPLANDTISYQYDVLNRMTNRAINSVNEGVAYDELGRITNHTSVLGTFIPAYVDASRRLSSLAYPNGQKTVFDYFNNLGDLRLKEIWNQNSSVATISKFDYEYDVLGRIKQWTQQADVGTPQVMSMDYDNEDQLLDAMITPQGQAPARTFAYGYDAAGNRTSEGINSTGANLIGTTSAYNSVNELLARSGAGPFPVRFSGKINEPATATVNGQTAKMTQDPNSASNGKIFTATLNLPVGNNNATVVATDFAIPTPHVTTSSYSVNVAGGQGKACAYDANGNLTNVVTATTTNNYAWDAENRLVKITQLSTLNSQLTTEFTYDGFGRRVQIVEKTGGTMTSTKKFVWIGKQLGEERDAGNTVTKRFFAEGEQIGGVSYYFTKDHLGSIREMTDGTGAIRARYNYDPYGRRTKVSGDMEADFGFTGYYVHAPSGLQLALYRAYDADIGRWPSRDPIGERGGLNLYDYVENNTLNQTDPEGKCSLACFAVAAAFVAAMGLLAWKAYQATKASDEAIKKNKELQDQINDPNFLKTITDKNPDPAAARNRCMFNATAKLIDAGASVPGQTFSPPVGNATPAVEATGAAKDALDTVGALGDLSNQAIGENSGDDD